MSATTCTILISTATSFFANVLYDIVKRMLAKTQDSKPIEDSNPIEDSKPIEDSNPIEENGAKPMSVTMLPTFIIVLVTGFVSAHLTGRIWAIERSERLLLFLVAGVVGIVLAALFMHREKVTTMLGGTLRGLITSIFLFGVVFASMNMTAPHYLDMNPLPDTVGDFEAVSGIVCEGVPQPVVVVHPVITDLWFVQKPPIVDADMKWRTHIIFAGQEGEEFEVIAIADRNQVFREGTTLGAKEVASADYRSKLDIVKMKRQSPE